MVQAATNAREIFDESCMKRVGKTRMKKNSMLPFTHESNVTYTICIPKVNWWSVSRLVVAICMGYSFRTWRMKGTLTTTERSCND